MDGRTDGRTVELEQGMSLVVSLCGTRLSLFSQQYAASKLKQEQPQAVFEEAPLGLEPTQGGLPWLNTIADLGHTFTRPTAFWSLHRQPVKLAEDCSGN